MKSRGFVGAALISTLVFSALSSGCAPDDGEVMGSDPGKPFSVRRVDAINGFAYASVLFKSAHDRADGPEGIVVVDLKNLFIDNAPVRKGANVVVWETGEVQILGKVGGALFGLTQANAWSGEGVVVRLYDVSGPREPVANGKIEIPSTLSEITAEAEALGESMVMVRVHSQPEPRLVIVRPQAAAGSQLVSDTPMPGGLCANLTLKGPFAYCVATTGEWPVVNPNVRVYAWNDATGLGDLVQELAVANLYLSPGSFLAHDGNALNVIDRGAGSGNPGGVIVLDIGSDGALSYRTKLLSPAAGSGRAIAVDGISFVSSAFLLATLSGAYLLDSSNGDVLGMNGEVKAGNVAPAEGLAAGYFVAGGADDGITLYQASSSALTRVGTYYRRWGDRFPNTDLIQEGKF